MTLMMLRIVLHELALQSGTHALVTVMSFSWQQYIHACRCGLAGLFAQARQGH
jgi:hypothetical protein